MQKNSQNLPPLSALQAFESAARHENFMAAATELNLSQSAISHRVRALERHLGYALFERLPRGLRLTESGKAYLPSIRSAFAEIMGATTSIFGVRQKTRLAIRAPLSYSAIWLSEIVSRFSVEHPDIEIRMNSSVWADRLALDETDIELRLGHGNWPGYKSELLFQDMLVPMCSAQTQQTLPKRVTADVLATRPLVHIVGIEDQWGDFFRNHKAGVSQVDQKGRIFTDSSVAAAIMSSNGPQICLLADRFASYFEKLNILCQASELTTMSKQGLYLVTPDIDIALVPEVEMFCTFLRTQTDTYFSPR
jgi:LysR family glycine cleavage system transcriptional activator